MSKFAENTALLATSTGVSTVIMGGLEYGVGTVMQNELADNAANSAAAANTDYNQWLDTANTLANTGPWLALGGAVLALASGSIYYWRYVRPSRQQ